MFSFKRDSEDFEKIRPKYRLMVEASEYVPLDVDISIFSLLCVRPNWSFEPGYLFPKINSWSRDRPARGVSWEFSEKLKNIADVII